MKFYITGGTGFIGTALSAELQKQNHSVIQLERDNKTWPTFDGEFGIINLAGATINQRFTQKAKDLIYNSRIGTTKNIIEQIKKSKNKPQVIVSASAIGYYGNRGEDILDESQKPGTDFLARVCVDWEKTINDFCKTESIRCVNIRTGHVLGNGGLLKALEPLFKFGFGGTLSNGKQYMSWISLTDIVNLYIFSAVNANVSGPINASTSEPVTNKEFTKQYAKFLHRPAIFFVPRFALDLLYGELGDLMLYSQRATNKKILGLGFEFNQNTIKDFFQNYKN